MSVEYYVDILYGCPLPRGFAVPDDVPDLGGCEIRPSGHHAGDYDGEWFLSWPGLRLDGGGCDSFQPHRLTREELDGIRDDERTMLPRRAVAQAMVALGLSPDARDIGWYVVRSVL